METSPKAHVPRRFSEHGPNPSIGTGPRADIKKKLSSNIRPRTELRSKVSPKLESPYDTFHLLDPKPDMPWDPWPVRKHKPTALFLAAQVLIRERNGENIDNAIDRVVLLPASGSIPGLQGGFGGVDLFSIRSPSKLPARIHMWMAPGNTVMMKKDGQTILLRRFLKTFDISSWSGTFKHYQFWESVILDHKVLCSLRAPKRFHQAMFQRWWSIHPFRFLDLPPELRIMVLKLAMEHKMKPYFNEYQQTPDPLSTNLNNTRLTLVNRQLKEESAAIMFAQVTFVFHKKKALLRFVKQIPQPYLLAITSLELNFDHGTLLSLFGAQVFPRSQRPGSRRSDTGLGFKLKHLRINFPHPREHSTDARLTNACQRTVCLWIWAGARRHLRAIPHVEFMGCIKDDQKKEWLEILALERKGILPDPEEMNSWQKNVWATPYVTFHKYVLLPAGAQSKRVRVECVFERLTNLE